MASSKNAAPVNVDTVDGIPSRIAARVDELKGARQTYLEQAQRQMSAFDAAIGELEAILKPPAPPAENGAAPAEPPGLAEMAQMTLPVAAG